MSSRGPQSDDGTSGRSARAAIQDGAAGGPASAKPLRAQGSRSALEPDTAPGIVTVATGIPRPGTAGSAATIRRSELVLWICAGTAAPLSAGELLAGNRGVGLTHLAAAALQGVLILLLRRVPKRADLLAQLSLGFALVDIAVSAYLSGGIRSPSAAYLAGIPLLAGALLGARSLLGWIAGALGALGALALADSAAHTVPASRFEWALKMGCFVVAAAVMSYALRRLNGWQVESLEHREETIRTLLRGLGEKNRELSAARDEALQASRAKGEFLAVMSHEIRTPLNAVIALTGVLLDTPLNAEQKDLTGTIRQSGGTLLTLLNEILDFSKMEAGRLDLESTPFDVVECAEDALELLSATAAEKRLDLSCIPSPDLPSRLLGDPGRVRQILVNLVSNAVKFTPSGSVQVHLTVESTGPEEGEIMIHGAVRDTGIGIPRDRLKVLFEPFSQVDASTTSKFGGTGLGLAICRKLAERMGGRAWVESNFGKGSAFHFTFAASVVAPAPEPLSKRGAAIVIHPDEGTRRSLIAQLAARGLTAHALSDVTDAVRPPSLSSPPSSRSPTSRSILTMKPDVLVIGHRVELTSVTSVLRGIDDSVPVIVVGSHDTSRLSLSGVGPLPGRRTAAVATPVRRSQLARALSRVLDGDAPVSLPPASLQLTSKRSLRVLVAEDNPVNQRVMKLLLEREGHRADIVGNGAEAIAEVRRGGYDVVLMDVRMPEMDGLTATRRILAELPKEQRPYIIALTANVTPADREECSAAGMDGFLPKPFVQKDLQLALLPLMRATARVH